MSCTTGNREDNIDRIGYGESLYDFSSY